MLAPEFLNTAVPLGLAKPDGTFRALGAGVLLHVHDVSWLVTARHVRMRATERREGDETFIAVGTTREGEQFPLELERILTDATLEWIDSSEEEDLSACPIPLSTEWALRTIPATLCLEIGDAVPSMPCYTVGIPYGFGSFDPERISPLVLDGVISGVHEAEGLLYVSAPTFQGNSGGPVFVYRSPFTAGGGLSVGKATVLFAGIVLQQLLVSGRGAARDPSVQAPPLHLGVVRSVGRINRLLDGDEARALVSRVRELQADDDTPAAPG